MKQSFREAGKKRLYTGLNSVSIEKVFVGDFLCLR